MWILQQLNTLPKKFQVCHILPIQTCVSWRTLEGKRRHLYAYLNGRIYSECSVTFAENVCVHGPMNQSQFLGSLGINFRVEALIQNCTEEQAESLRTGYWRLVGEGEAPFWEGPDDETPIGMGTRYLAMAIVNKKQGAPVPFQ